MFERIKGLLLLLSFAASLVLGIVAISKLTLSESEENRLPYCYLDIPPDVMFTYILVGRINAPGYIADKMWLDINYYGKDPELVLTYAKARVAGKDEYSGKVRQQLEEAVSKNFRLDQPVSDSTRKDILLVMRQDVEMCPDVVRRLDFSERLKDFLAYFGAAALSTLAGFGLARIFRHS